MILHRQQRLCHRQRHRVIKVCTMLKKISVLILIVSSSLLANRTLISPTFYSTAVTDTMFRNPAELVFHDKIVEGRINFNYDDEDISLGATAILHLPDNTYFGSSKWGYGDIALVYDAFGNNIHEIELRTDRDLDENRFVFADSASRLSLTWAKRLRFATFGANVKYYNYTRHQESSRDRFAVGMDVGFYITPFEDLFIGVVGNDIGDTKIRNISGDTVDEIETEYRLSLAVLSGDDMSFSIGAPFDIFEQFEDDSESAWKEISIQGHKTFDDTIGVTLGSNTRDLFGQLTYHFNKNFNISLLGTQNLDTENRSISLVFSAGIPTQKKRAASSTKRETVTDRTPQPSQIDSPPTPRTKAVETKKMVRPKKGVATRRQTQLENSKQERIDAIEDQIEENKFDDIEDQIDDQIDDIRIRKLQRKKDQLQRLRD